MGGLRTSAEAHLRERWGCCREKDGVGTRSQALPSQSLWDCAITPAMPGNQAGGGGHVRIHCLQSNTHTHCCHSISQQHGATGDSRPPAPSVAMTQLSHWTILCCSNGTPYVLKNLLPLCPSLFFPYLNHISQGGTRKWNIYLKY